MRSALTPPMVFPGDIDIDIDISIGIGFNYTAKFLKGKNTLLVLKVVRKTHSLRG